MIEVEPVTALGDRKEKQMCNPASFVVMKQGKSLKVFWSDDTSESHEDIIEHFKLNEKNVRDEITLVRVEITPPGNNFAVPLKKWRYQLDQDLRPEWYDEKEVERAARKELKEWLAAKVVLPGQKREVIEKGKHVAIMFGEVGVMRGSSQVGEMRGSSQVGVMRGNSQVGVMRGSSQVGVMWGSSQVGVMWGNSQVGVMWESSQVGVMWESSLATTRGPQIQTALASKDAVVIDRSVSPPECYVGKQDNDKDKT